jgi:hypothetical protein
MARSHSLRSMFRRAPAALAVFALAAASAACSGAPVDEDEAAGTASAVSERPPQYVLLAFDGSKSLPFWNESREFAKQATRAGKPVKFTYFISGVYFRTDATKGDYKGPGRSAGRSDIGFGGTAEDLAERVNQLNLAVGEGHEMASHANGHFDGSQWSSSDWTSEFEQFDKLVFKNADGTRRDMRFGPDDVVGFRAPLLGHGAGLWPTLRGQKFTYDTSKSAAANYWPQKIDGTWNFPLAQLVISGSGKRTLSMDYNFYVADSKGVSDPGNKEKYKRQMVDTYRKYFESNYYGNRAPVDIGHHFSKWNGGAYWEAMKEFALEVCGKPEVKCVTYKELVTFMESRSSAQIADYKNGAFPRMQRGGGQDSLDDLGDEPVTGGEYVGDVAAAHEDHDDE